MFTPQIITQNKQHRHNCNPTLNPHVWGRMCLGMQPILTQPPSPFTPIRVARHKHEYIAPIDDDIATRIQRVGGSVWPVGDWCCRDDGASAAGADLVLHSWCCASSILPAHVIYKWLACFAHVCSQLCAQTDQASIHYVDPEQVGLSLCKTSTVHFTNPMHLHTRWTVTPHTSFMQPNAHMHEYSSVVLSLLHKHTACSTTCRCPVCTLQITALLIHRRSRSHGGCATTLVLLKRAANGHNESSRSACGCTLVA